MAHLAYIRPGGLWYGGVPVLHGELTQMDQTLFKCINGDNGGTWAPTSVITIGGAGVQFTTSFLSDGYSRLGTSSADNLDVYATVGFNSPIDIFSGALTLHPGVPATIGGTLSVSGGASFVGVSCSSLGVSSSITCPGSVALGSLLVSGSTGLASLTCSGNLTVSGGASVTTTMTLSGAGAIAERVVTGSDTDSTYSVSTADVVFVPNTLTAPRQYTLDHVGAVTGKKMKVVLAQGAASSIEVDLLDISGGRITIGSVRLKNSPGHCTTIDVQFIGGLWKFVGYSPAF